MQSVRASQNLHSGDDWELPHHSTELLPGIEWGCPSEVFSPAFWKFQSKASREAYRNNSFRLGNSLIEEVAVCLLGGHGLPAELGLAAFNRLRDLDLIRKSASQIEIEAALTEPLKLNGKLRRYRFPRQKAKFLWHAFQAISDLPEGITPRCLRDLLVALPGIGPKTASWIVRNHFGADDVAILDVHILRAGALIGIFPHSADPSRHYFVLEQRFLEFCGAIEEPASIVDALMWDYMRRIGPTAPVRRRSRQYDLVICQ